MIFVQDIKTYLEVVRELPALCKKWAENHLEKEQQYVDYTIISKNKIAINYKYDCTWYNGEEYITYLDFDSTHINIEEILCLQD